MTVNAHTISLGCCQLCVVSSLFRTVRFSPSVRHAGEPLSHANDSFIPHLNPSSFLLSFDSSLATYPLLCAITFFYSTTLTISNSIFLLTLLPFLNFFTKVCTR